MALFFNVSLDNSKTDNFSLSDVISINSANAESTPCPVWCIHIGGLCDNYYPPYGEVPFEVIFECSDGNYKYVYEDDDPIGHLTTGTYLAYGNDCEDASTSGPLYCEMNLPEC